MKSEGCGSTPLGKNFERLNEMIRINDPRDARSTGQNQWKEVHQHPLFQRYHGLGSDFSARGVPFHSRNYPEEETYPVMEKKPEVDWVDVENILRLLNGYRDGTGDRRKRVYG